MKANIPREQEIAIYDYINLILMVEVLENKAKKGTNVDKPIGIVLDNLAKIKKYLHVNQIKVHPVVVDSDGLFVQYNFTVRVNGGFAQGDYRFWRAGLVLMLNKKMKLLQEEDKIIEGNYIY